MKIQIKGSTVAEPKVTLILTPNRISEAGGGSRVTATLDKSSPQATTVTVTAAPVSPAVPGDYTLSTNRVLLIAAGTTTSTGEVAITAVDNDVDAPNKTVTVVATADNSQGVTNPEPVTLTITNDDSGGGSGGDGDSSVNRPPVVDQEIGPQTVAAGGALEVNIQSAFHDPDRDALDYAAESADPTVVTASVGGGAVVTIAGYARGVVAVTVTAADPHGESVAQTFDVTVLDPARVPLFPSVADTLGRQGFVRIVNHADEAGEVVVEAIDDAGLSAGTLTLPISANAVAHFNSTDLEEGNADKGLAEGVGTGRGNWRLVLTSDLPFTALAYVRTTDGFLTSMHDVAPAAGNDRRVAIFNPASNANQRSHLRLVNPGDREAEATITGTDGTGVTPGVSMSVAVPAGGATELSAAELETALGDGVGKWRLDVRSTDLIAVMSLLEGPAGHLTNLSTVPAPPEDGGAHVVPLFPSASDALGRQGVVRVRNRSAEAGEVAITAYDDGGVAYEPVALALGAGATTHFNSDDLELGNAAKGLAGSTGAGTGDWRLELTSGLDLDVLAYARTRDGFLTSMHDVAPTLDDALWIAIFNPGGNRNQISNLRLVNPGDADASVTITGTDDRGASPGTAVTLVVPAGASRTLGAEELENGAEGFEGALGDGAGKWRLRVVSDRPILAMSLLASPTGHLTNLSTAPGRGVR